MLSFVSHLRHINATYRNFYIVNKSVVKRFKDKSYSIVKRVDNRVSSSVNNLSFITLFVKLYGILIGYTSHAGVGDSSIGTAVG